MEAYFFVVLGWFCGSIAGGATGLGSMMIALPILSLGIPASKAVLVSCLIGVPACMQMAWLYRKYVIWSELRWMVLGCIPGCVLGALTLKVVPVGYLQIMISAMIFIFVTLQLFSRKATWTLGDSNGWGVLAGFGGGFAHGSVSVVGVPIGIYVLLKRWERDRARACMSGFFLFSGFITMVSQWAVGLYEVELVKLAAAGLVGSLVGQRVGFQLGRRLDQKLFVRFVLFFLTMSACILFYKGIQ